MNPPSDQHAVIKNACFLVLKTALESFHLAAARSPGNTPYTWCTSKTPTSLFWNLSRWCGGRQAGFIQCSWWPHKYSLKRPSLSFWYPHFSHMDSGGWPTSGEEKELFSSFFLKRGQRKLMASSLALCPMPCALNDRVNWVLWSVSHKVHLYRGQDAAIFLLQLAPCFGKEIRTGLRD